MLNLIIFYYQPYMEGEKGQAQKVRKDKRKNTETGLLMGQNTNIFSQLSATYLQSKPSTTQQQLSFVKQTQIIQYHDPKINRLITLLRKKADITKTKAAVELREEVMRMGEENISEFMQTFSHLFMEIVINQQSKQTIDQFVNMMNYLLANFKKIAIKQIATIFGPLLVINRSYNLSQQKIYAMLFNGSDEQIQEKAIVLLLNKNVTKKFLIFCRVIIECEETHKISDHNFQRNCSFLLKVLKQLIKSYNGIVNKKQELTESFSRFMVEINEIVSSKFVEDYFKVGGKAKSSFLQFYQALISEAARHPQWPIRWQSFAKIICQNYLDKDPVVQQSLWKYCNRQFIQSTLEFEKREAANQQEGEKQKQKYRILHKYLPKPEEKLMSAVKLGGQSLYKELASYCQIFPYTTFEPKQSHKAIINKIAFMRKLMQTLLELEDENQARIQCYYQLVKYFLQAFRNLPLSEFQAEDKKLNQIKALSLKAQKELVNNLQQKYYKSPPASRNSFSYNIPTYFCRILVEAEPNFDYFFDRKQTIPLYCLLKTTTSQYCQNLFTKIFQSCQEDDNLIVEYLENFPPRSIKVDMSEKNPKIEQAARMFLLSLEAGHEQWWFGSEWDIRKKLICFDPRLTWGDATKFLEQQHNNYVFKPSSKSVPHQEMYIRVQHDEIRFEYFLKCLRSDEQINIVACMLPLIKDVLFQRNHASRARMVNRILQLHSESVEKLLTKNWVVSQPAVLRLRVVCDLIFQGLRRASADGFHSIEQIDRQKLDKFTFCYCQFALTIYNYKLQSDSEELLKLVTKALSIDLISQSILKSVEDTLKVAYQNYAKNSPLFQGQVQKGQQRQRKNRLSRFLNFVNKLLWYGVNKKKQQNIIQVFEKLLSNEDWKYAQFRAELWMLSEIILETLDQRLIQKIVNKILLGFHNHAHFLTLLMCSHLILPLQRHPSTKKVILQLQAQVFKSVKQNPNLEQNCQILNAVITQATHNQSFLLINGAKNLLKNLMKNYQEINPEQLKKYGLQCFEKPYESLIKSESKNFNKNCLLLRSLCSQLPLLDLPNIEEIYNKLQKSVITEEDNLKKLGYLAILSSMWQSGVGVQKLTAIQTSQIASVFKMCLDGLLTNTSYEQVSFNFARYYGLTFLNSFLQIKQKDYFNDCWQFILNQVVLAKVQQGMPLHGEIQSARYSLISKIFTSCPKDLQNQLVGRIPDEILSEVRFYKEVLDFIEEDQDQEQAENKSRYYENIVSIFIQFAEVLVRITGCLTKEVKPREEVMLQLLQCPFAGIKKTAFILLKQMYSLKLVDRTPPPIFQMHLQLDSQALKAKLDPLIANIISGYLYSWQAIIERREATEGSYSSVSQDQNSLSLEDYLQCDQLHEQFLKNVFEVIQFHLGYTQNQSEFEMMPEELIEMDSIVTIEDDLNLNKKIFRLIARTFFLFVQNFPFFLRDFVDRNKKFRVVCDRLLRNLVSDAIFKQEITRIEMREHQWKSAGNFEIYVIPKNKEIYAQYIHDVIRIGLRLVMKGNYPITPISIEFGEGLKIQEGSRWALMLQSQLHNRNNTIINGILLWKENIDKKLSGVEECAICFDIVNGSGQLPRKGCKTCKKKFHSVCIMKWFNKSNKSQCPLCKSQFL